MRKLEEKMNKAIRNRQNFSNSNTSVQTYSFFDNDVYCEESKVFLHGNHIATYDHVNKELSLYDGGWQTVTTRKVFSASDSIVHSFFKFSHNNKNRIVVWLL